VRRRPVVALLWWVLAAGALEAQSLPKPDKIVLVFFENKDYEDVVMTGLGQGQGFAGGPAPAAVAPVYPTSCGSPPAGAKFPAPYITWLAMNGASLTTFAFHHPSQPNYIEFFFGTNRLSGINDSCDGTSTIVDDCCFTAPTTTRSIIDSLGSSFAGYAEKWTPQVPINCCDGCDPWTPQCGCPAEVSDDFARRHCPWLVAPNGLQHARSFDDFPTTPAGFAALPPFTMVTPDLVNDMHSLPDGVQMPACVSQTPYLTWAGDYWLNTKLSAYAQWALANNSLLVITFDENDDAGVEGYDEGAGLRPPNNHIATILYGAGVQPGSNGGNTVYNHYDLQKTLLQMLGKKPVGNAVRASTITGIWKTARAARRKN
jgi:phosphatidylinositol-3-phosphatase